MNDDPLMRVMRNIKTSPGPGVGEAIDKNLPPYASQADPLREALAGTTSGDWMFVREDDSCHQAIHAQHPVHPELAGKALFLLVGDSAEAEANAEFVIAARKAALAQSPAPQGEGTREALQRAIAIIESEPEFPGLQEEVEREIKAGFDWDDLRQFPLSEICAKSMLVACRETKECIANRLREEITTLAATPIPSDCPGYTECQALGKTSCPDCKPSDRAGREEEIADEQVDAFVDAYLESISCTEKFAPDPEGVRIGLAAALRHSSAGIERAAEWQPIETAPRNGRHLLLTRSDSEFPVVACFGRRHIQLDGEWLTVLEWEPVNFVPEFWMYAPSTPRSLSSSASRE